MKLSKSVSSKNIKILLGVALILIAISSGSLSSDLEKEGFIKRLDFGRRTGPHDWGCYSSEINQIKPRDAAAFKCLETRDGVDCNINKTFNLKIIENIAVAGDNSGVYRKAVFSSINKDTKKKEIYWKLKDPSNGNHCTNLILVKELGGSIFSSKSPVVYIRCESGGPPFSTYKLDFENSTATSINTHWSNSECTSEN